MDGWFGFITGVIDAVKPLLLPKPTFWAEGEEEEADDAESELDVSVVVNRPKMREVRLIARTPQPTRSWCGPDHGVGMRR